MKGRDMRGGMPLRHACHCVSTQRVSTLRVRAYGLTHSASGKSVIESLAQGVYVLKAKLYSVTLVTL